MPRWIWTPCDRTRIVSVTVKAPSSETTMRLAKETILSPKPKVSGLSWALDGVAAAKATKMSANRIRQPGTPVRPWQT
jgi:hypothetical protein